MWLLDLLYKRAGYRLLKVCVLVKDISAQQLEMVEVDARP